MAIVTKVIPYEILLRFSEGAEHQSAPAGEFEGAHYIERTRFVDEDTGAIVGTPAGQETDKAVALPREKVEAYLGERFLSIEAALRRATSERDALAAQLTEANKTIAAREATIDAAWKALEVEQKNHAETHAARQAVSAELAALRDNMMAVAQGAAVVKAGG
jgi:chromosome segregation ATPase